MDIKPEDFPLYDVLVQFNDPRSVHRVIHDMREAQIGGAQEKFNLVMGLWPVANMENIEQMLPGATDAVRTATIEKCGEVLQALAAGGHQASQQMLRYLYPESKPKPPAP